MEISTDITNEEELYAEVLIDSNIDLDNHTFTYLVPPEIKKYITLGTPVIVPFGSTEIGGFVINIFSENPLNDNITVKSIISATNVEQVFGKDFIEFIKWISEYYYTNFVNVLKASIPSGILTKAVKTIGLKIPKEEFASFIGSQTSGEFRKFCEYILKADEFVRFSALKANFGRDTKSFLKRLILRDVIKSDFIFNTKTKYKKNLCVTYLKSEGNLTNREKEVLEIISKNNGFLTLKEAIEKASTSSQLLKNLAEKKCVNISEQIILRKPQDYAEGKIRTEKLNLNFYQKKALDRFIEIQNEERHDKTLLLHGVTGSGKTEVYLQAIDYILNQGKTALVLVPEISLTPQTVSRFRARFGECIAVLHSALNDGEKFDEWSRIRSGLAKIIIGARSAIFAPLENIGVIVIDEEHETSYKQDNNPKYNAKTLAIKRCELSNATLILGSATPSLESYYKSLSHPNWELLEIPERVENKTMPQIRLVDMREEKHQGHKGIFSRHLENAIRARLEKKEQVMIFINRRGYSTFVLCRECGYSVTCGNCSVTMVYHTTNEGHYLKCHYCGNKKELPSKCPKCYSREIGHFGIGSQKIETIAKKIFPTANIARLDRDTAIKKDSHYEILKSFSSGEYDILIGTQMIAKGLDFPNVTLVGIITADTALNLPDFRAGERTFQLITQVAGRSGRGDEKGEVIVQAYSLEHISIQSSKNHDYKLFYQNEIKEREEAIYPPFCELINIIVANSFEYHAKEDAKKFGTLLKENKTEDIISILGPIPAGIPKIKNYYRYQILIKTKDLKKTKEVITKSREELRTNAFTQIGFDIEPINML